MTVSSETARQQHSGNGVTTSFTTGFAFLANSHVRVVHTDDLGVNTTWVENTQYTLSGADTGLAGTLTIVTTPLNYTPQTGDTLTIIRDLPFTQELDADTLETLPASSIEDAYDKIWMALGQLKEQLSRAATSSETGSEPTVLAWSPVLGVATDGSRRVFQIDDWTGGSGDKPDTGQYVGATGLVDSIGDGADVRGPAGANGSGSGDMVAANNLSDLADKPTAFANIKQAATTSATGVLEIATDGEAQAKSDTGRALVPSNLAALGASATFAGLVELATDAETITGTDQVRATTPHSVAAAIAAAAQSFAAGTAMLFVQTSAPTGWTKSTTHNDKALRVVSGSASSGGSVNFSTLFGRTATDAVTLIQANLPNVGLGTFVSAAGSTANATAGSDVAAIVSLTTGTVSLGGSGTSFSPAIDCRVKYVDTIIATKD